MGKKTICVLFGGKSSEHEVSLLSAYNVITYLDKEKYDLITVGITKEGAWRLYRGGAEAIRDGSWEAGPAKRCHLSPEPDGGGLLVFNKNGDTFREHFDVAFPVLHGKNGEDGTIQGLFELAGVPYVGSGVLASALCMDKVLSKNILTQAGIPVTEGFSLTAREAKDAAAADEKIRASFGYPVVVKPSNAGSSVGVTLVKEPEQLAAALAAAAREDRRLLVERAVDARELECAVLGGYGGAEASGVGEIINGEEMYDYDTKYKTGTARTEVHPDIPEEISEDIRRMAVRAFMAHDCCGLARVDFFLDRQTGRVTLNELNTMPGFTDISMYPMLWEAAGLPYARLLDRLIDIALDREGKTIG